MRIFKNKPFSRFARKARITDAVLRATIDAAMRGLIDADLGGGVLKQRVAREGGGKSGGFRTIILFRVRERAFFVHGFAKNEQDTIRYDELVAFRKLASVLMTYDDDALARALANGTLTEVAWDDQAVSQPCDGLDPRDSRRAARGRGHGQADDARIR